MIKSINFVKKFCESVDFARGTNFNSNSLFLCAKITNLSSLSCKRYYLTHQWSTTGVPRKNANVKTLFEIFKNVFFKTSDLKTESF